MKIYTDLRLQNNKFIFDDNLMNYPENPELGEIAFVNGVLWLYTDIDSNITWYPLTNKAHYHVHNQITAESAWNVTHNLGSQDLVYMVYDDNNNVQLADVDFVDDDNIVINLIEPMTGKLVIFATSNSYADGSSRIIYVDKYAERVVHHGNVSGALTVSLDAGMVHTMTITDDTTINFSGWATGDRSSGITLVINNGGNFVVSYNDTILWSDGKEPVLTLNGQDRLAFMSEDGGNTISGFISGLNMS